MAILDTPDIDLHVARDIADVGAVIRIGKVVPRKSLGNNISGGGQRKQP
jgi:hypothetical protein